MTHSTKGPASRRAPRIRGFSAGGKEADIAARMPGLDAFTGRDPEALRTALRAMRRRRQRMDGAYDAARHAALVRLLKQTAPPRRTAPSKPHRSVS